MDDEETTTISCQARFFAVDVPKINRLAKFVCARLGVADYELSITFVDPDKMRELNREFRDKDRSTDVLSFPQQSWNTPLLVTPPLASDEPETGHLHDDPNWPGAREEPPKVLGDIVISLQDAKENAERIVQPLDREVAFLLVHGILHLCGHDHQDPQDERLMINQQQILMDLLKHPQPPLWMSSVKFSDIESRIH